MDVSMPLRLGNLRETAERGAEADFIEQRRMQQMRHAADLLDGAIDQSAAFGGTLLLSTLRLMSGRTNAVQHHLCGGQILSQTVVKFARDAPAFFVLRGDQSCWRGGAVPDSAIFELPGLSVQFGKDADLGAQQFRNDRNGNVVDRAALVAFQAVEIGEMHGGNEDDGGLLKARMLANHVGQLETVELRHADVHQHDGDVGLQQAARALRCPEWP